MVFEVSGEDLAKTEQNPSRDWTALHSGLNHPSRASSDTVTKVTTPSADLKLVASRIGGVAVGTASRAASAHDIRAFPETPAMRLFSLPVGPMRGVSDRSNGPKAPVLRSLEELPGLVHRTSDSSVFSIIRRRTLDALPMVIALVMERLAARARPEDKDRSAKKSG
jgi:hypothetical protein